MSPAAKLLRAVMYGESERVVELIREGADPNDPSEPRLTTPLEAAAQNGDLEMAKLLVAHGADVNFRFPLRSAAMYGRVEMVKYLLSQGADINYCLGGIETPAALLAVCASLNAGSVEVLEVLVDAGIDMRFKDTQYIPLNEAAWNGHAEVVSYLLEHGAEVNRQDSGGRTALYRAAFSGHANVVRILLEAGADPAIRASHGKLASQIAHERGHYAVRDMLQKHQGQK